jgi:hypothetical protein
MNEKERCSVISGQQSIREAAVKQTGWRKQATKQELKDCNQWYLMGVTTH